MHTADSAGKISTPWFGEQFEETKFFRRVDYTYNISLPSEATNKTMVLEMMLDTKETKGAIDEIRIFSPEGYGNELMNFLVQKMKAGDIGFMKGKNHTLEETVYNISIYMNLTKNASTIGQIRDQLDLKHSGT